MQGQVKVSINNVYKVLAEDGAEYTCRIKGKKLILDEWDYNPIAVGDYVEFAPYSEGEGLVTGRLPRKSAFTRWNLKLEKNQTICANMDQVAIIASILSPPFRPHFLDRAISCVSGADVVIVLNKCDNEASREEEERLSLYESLGYRVLCVSAKTGEGLGALTSLLEGKTTAFVGQSGVGKSSLVNVICQPERMQSVREVSEKYNRGKHTTNHALCFERDGFIVIDTPGVREILPPMEELSEVLKAFPEFSGYECHYPGCLHISEDGCGVKEALKEGKIDSERYESYLRISKSISERSPEWKRRKFRKNKQN